jgi:hypothetical protein
VPLKNRAPCYFCGDVVDTRKPGHYELEQGWVKKRSQGGGNALALPVSLGLYACSFCMEKQQHGLNASQGVLFR